MVAQAVVELAREPVAAAPQRAQGQELVALEQVRVEVRVQVLAPSNQWPAPPSRRQHRTQWC